MAASGPKAPAASAVSAAITASQNSASYDFSTVAKNARATLDAGIQQVGSALNDYTTAAQWNQMLGGMDRRSLYAVATNKDGLFSSAEQQVANSTMLTQVGNAFNAPGGDARSNAAGFQKQIDLLESASPEEKQSVGWAMNMAAARTSYNLEASDAGLPAQDGTYMSPLVKVLMAAMKAAQSDPSKDLVIGRQDTLADIKAQPWAQGFGDQIDQAYAATIPQGRLLNIQA